MKMSSYEGDGDIQQEGAQEVDGIQSSGDGQDNSERGSVSRYGSIAEVMI